MRFYTRTDIDFHTVFDKMTEEYNDEYYVTYFQDEFDNQTSMKKAHIPFQYPYGIMSFSEIAKEKGIRAKLVKLETSDPDYNGADYVIVFFDMMDYLRFV